ncbi:MAG: GNAT family N-acetyltransferase [Anaerolineales bacterium]|nr:GNAT family N-acetyltransferase [Anaerolineales bacterium]
MPYTIQLLESPEEMTVIEVLQEQVWPGAPIDVVPAHLLLTAIHNGGMLLGAFEAGELIGFSFGLPGFDMIPDGPRPKHCSHMLGVHPNHRGRGIGFALKRAQWQFVRNQGIDHITWTYDPLLSTNAYLNIARLGAVCSIYRREEYGQMRDGLNAGLASDRFQVDWWINTPRVQQRLGDKNRVRLDLDHYTQANVQHLYRPITDATSGLLRPPKAFSAPEEKLALARIPSDFQAMRTAAPALARDWRFFTRQLFEEAFHAGYIITDFVYEHNSAIPHSYYILSHGESVIG